MVFGFHSMDSTLATMIERFRAAQDRAVALLANELAKPLRIRLPKSNRDWVTICAESGLYKVRRFNGVEIYAHGYGVELVTDGINIDFDWGDNGEADGFDGWRLWNFCRMNDLPRPCDSSSQIKSWLVQAVECNELLRDELLFYSPAHRARV
jgi:Domain of unknown function (DUF6896)